MSTNTYKIVRFYRDDAKESEVVRTGFTLEQAKQHCNDPKTTGANWFDGFEEETP